MYLIEKNNLNLNSGNKGYTTFEITDAAPRTNQGGQLMENGWLGDTNNVRHVAHGSHNDEAACLKAAAKIAGVRVNQLEIVDGSFGSTLIVRK
jgi:hypothetical protein